MDRFPIESVELVSGKGIRIDEKCEGGAALKIHRHDFLMEFNFHQ